MMKVKFVIAALAIAAFFTACQFAGESPKSMLDKANGEMAQMEVLGNLTKKMQGIWLSDSDPKSELRIEGEWVTSIYEGKDVSRDRLIWHMDCPQVCTQGMGDITEILCFMLESEAGSTCYGLLSIGDKTLEYTLMPGTGKSLVYTKTKDLPKKEAPQAPQ